MVASTPPERVTRPLSSTSKLGIGDTASNRGIGSSGKLEEFCALLCVPPYASAAQTNDIEMKELWSLIVK
ncbi:hypothetical protein [Alloacidobacterium sp.]|uniref:hypothetical protein n=1 Tax=Alloacidobacterium sp. TaxID=2951999 RepID=UPI002D76C5B6|nr:hypothetical protein [Alloacidobacterium sp.]